jgi:5-bromo-4-chloroindolyl phosphate hydrolysis protein
MLTFFFLAIVCYSPILLFWCLKIGITNLLLISIMEFFILKTIFSFSFEALYKPLKVYLIKEKKRKKENIKKVSFK